MAHCQPLVSLLLVINLNSLMTECGTRAADSQSELRLHSSLLSRNKLCLHLCIRHPKKRQAISFNECIKQCEQGEAPKVLEKGKNLVSVRLRRKRTAKTENPKCRGVVNHDKNVAGPVPTKILKVDYKAGHSSGELHYNICWKPFDEVTIKEHNWTHYSLFYKFIGDKYDTGQEMDCALIPKNTTCFLLTFKPPWSRERPTTLHSIVVSYPFRGDDNSKIKLQEFSSVDRTSIPTFKPFFAMTTQGPKFNIAIPIASGSASLLVILLLAIYIWRRRVSRPCEDLVGHQSIAMANNSKNSTESYYSCYYPESEAFRLQVAAIVNRFRNNGYDVIMDAMASHEVSSLGPSKWAEGQIRKAKKVLVFLSPGLLKLSLGNEGVQTEDINRVWLELEVLRSIYNSSRSPAKTLCLELPNVSVSPVELPVFLQVIYKWPRDFEKILRSLNDRPSILPK